MWISGAAYANFEIRGGKGIRNVEAEIVPYDRLFTNSAIFLPTINVAVGMCNHVQ